MAMDMSRKKLYFVSIISHLHFHQAFGVTMWELFSYGFQPWAALTGHQILEAIDEQVASASNSRCIARESTIA